ncbi:uncharacterized protein LOC124134702 [Haliotis rufescens]|uniref:uncharacterized protein LOC124134702 n=1 Tax=Haliotis rufescens TaxID=6454 RepID=UPI00201EDC4D|nr:uncharacterized protein LOC124134702 [Haliotis rufescens]
MMVDIRTCFVVCGFLYFVRVEGFPIYGELYVNVSQGKAVWDAAEKECRKDGFRLTNYVTVESLKNIGKGGEYWIGGVKDEEEECPMLNLSGKGVTKADCAVEKHFLCSPPEIANMNHVIMIAVGAFTVINMILVTICVLRRVCKRRARQPKEKKPKSTSKKDDAKEGRKKKDKRQKKDAKMTDDSKQETPTGETGKAEPEESAGGDEQTAKTTAVVEGGPTGTADAEPTLTTAAAASSASADGDAGKDEKLPDPPDFLLKDSTSAAVTTVATDSTAVSAIVVSSTATAVFTAGVTSAVDTGIASGSITATETKVEAAKEADEKMSCQEAPKDGLGQTDVTYAENKPSLMSEMEAMLQGKSIGSKQGEVTPILPTGEVTPILSPGEVTPIPPPPPPPE